MVFTALGMLSTCVDADNSCCLLDAPVVGGCVLLVYSLERAKTQAIPDSVAIIGFGKACRLNRGLETEPRTGD